MTLNRMQLLATASAYFIKSPRSILKCCRRTSALTVVKHSALAEENDIHILGEVLAVLGKIQSDGCTHLLVITASTIAASFDNSQAILRVDRIAAIPLVNDGRIDANILQNGHFHGLERLKNQPKKLLKFVADRTAPANIRLLDDILKLINDSGNFYYSNDADITSCTQRSLTHPGINDDRFFWNRSLLKDFFEDNGRLIDGCGEWVVPVIYGFVNQKEIVFDAESKLSLTLISRRSTQRAGVRYLRRGIDSNGHVANFVETELILRIFGHCLSFVQIRGSVPVFWSQKGYRYRPPLTIDRPISESLPVFKAHMEELTNVYGRPVVAVNLVNQTGRELGLADSFLQHILDLDSEDIQFFAFDFHHHCRALRFENVQILMNALEPKLAKMGFCWVDKSGEIIFRQSGVVRTNCVDCLDRTNVVQSAISQIVCFTQARKLGVIDPITDVPEPLLQALQSLWADHGDCISRQYAGTDALKGDVTRSGQRKFMGLMKDGYNSASRYYLSHVRDAQRQRAIDALVSGNDVLVPSEEAMAKEAEEEPDESENIGRLVHETVSFVLPEGEILVGGWALVDGASLSNQIDTVLLLTRSHIYIAVYGDDTEKLEEVKVLSFSELQRVELGQLGKSHRVHMRIYWRPSRGTNHTIQTTENGNSTLYMSWRAAKTRLFNNVAIPLKDNDEADEYVNAIAEQIRLTVSMCADMTLPVVHKKLSGTSTNKHRPFVVNMFVSALKLRHRGRPNIKNQSEESGGPPPPIITFDGLEEREPTTVTNEGNSAFPQLETARLPHSQSDCVLTRPDSLSTAPTSGPSFLDKLQSKMKNTQLWKSSTALSDASHTPAESSGEMSSSVAEPPFEKYKERIANSKSSIYLL